MELEDKIDQIAENIQLNDQKNNEGFARLEKMIDSLALVTKRGFDSVDQRFSISNERFDRLEKQIDSVERGQKILN